MNTYELIDAAATILENHGFSQGANARDANGVMTTVTPAHAWPQPVAFCAYGALCRAGMGQPDTINYFDVACTEDRALDALDQHSPTGGIVSFNDTPGRTKEEVVTLMRHTANILRTIDQGAAI